MKEYQTYIFDLDGTLLNTIRDLAASVNYALRSTGMAERTLEEVREFDLDDGYFTGYIDSGDGKQSFFQLERVEDNGYDHDYGWDFRAQRPLQTKGTAEKGK